MRHKKIYVLAPETRHPSGGIKQLFRLVDGLNSLGYEAALIQRSRAKRITWFANETKIVYFPYLYFLLRQIVIKGRNTKKWSYKLSNFLFFSKKLPSKDSIIVLPEIYGHRIVNIIPENRYVIFNQNCFLTYNLFPYNQTVEDPYKNRNILACMTVSENSKAYLQFVYPDLPIHRMRLGLGEMFRFSGKKQQQIAFMPRKLSEDSNQIINILKTRDKIRGWHFVPIDNKSEDEVAHILKESALFLSFNYQEGLGLPPLEAMACGCYVIGYAGQAGVEYFKEEFSSLVVDRDIIAFAKEIERIAAIYDANPDVIQSKGKAASEYVRAVYNMANEKQDVKNIWDSIMENALD